MPESSSVLSFCCCWFCCWCWGFPFESTEVNEIGPSNGREIVSNNEEVRNEWGGVLSGSKSSTLSMKTIPVELVRVNVAFESTRWLGLVCCELTVFPNVVKLIWRSDPELELSESMEPVHEEGMALCGTLGRISSSSNEESVCASSIGWSKSLVEGWRLCGSRGIDGINFVDGESRSRRRDALVWHKSPNESVSSSAYAKELN